MIAHVAAIVEGHGEVKAVPILLRRIAGDVNPALCLKIHGPIRTSASSLLKDGGLERSVELAGRMVGTGGGLLVLLDCDWPNCCPAFHGPELRARAMATRPDLLQAVVLAKMEFEAWFLAAAMSLRGSHGLADDLYPPHGPEDIRDAKGWLSQHMGLNGRYLETTHQASFTAIFNIQSARERSPSFDKLYRDVYSMLDRLAADET